MKVVDFDGKHHTISIQKHAFTERSKASKGHKSARELLVELYPFETILEEVTIPRCNMYLDFLIPSQRIAVEVHGRQHFEFVQHFHKDKFGFLKHKARDRRKAEWCELNDINLIVLKAEESTDEWRQQISQG